MNLTPAELDDLFGPEFEARKRRAMGNCTPREIADSLRNYNAVTERSQIRTGRRKAKVAR